MPIISYLGMGAALIVVGFVIIFSHVPVPQSPPEQAPIPIATLEAVGSTTPFHVQLEALIPSADVLPALTAALTASTSTEATPPVITPPAIPKKPAPQPLPPPKPIVPVVVSVPAPTPAPAPTPTPADTSTTGKLSAASVNILCTGNGGNVRGASGSGVIIDPRGIIMTVAHIAQYYLLEDYPTAGSISCVIRTGSPAKRSYYARLIYISEAWLTKNPRTLVSYAPTGSGENDIAFLAITGSATGSSLPKTFPYVPLSSSDPKKGDEVIVVAYPAQTLSSTQIQANLPQTIARSRIKDRYTFGSTSTDVISLSGSEAAQTGSSGGGVSTLTGAITALVTTSSTEGPYVSRSFQAITTNYIRRSFKADTGKNLDSYLSNPVATMISNFERGADAPLASVLIRGIEQ